MDLGVPRFRPGEKSRVSVSVARTHSTSIATSLHSMRQPKKPTQSRNAITTSDYESRKRTSCRLLLNLECMESKDIAVAVLP